MAERSLAGAGLGGARSWLFVPALRASDWIPKAIASGADAVIVDLEDSTPPDQKDSARQIVRELTLERATGCTYVVRVNAADLMDADIAAAARSGFDAVLLPKVQFPGDVERAHGSGLRVVALLETASGVARAVEIAASAVGLCAIAFGSVDFAADVGAMPSSEGTELLLARSQIILAAAIAGIPAIDSPYADVGDIAGLETESQAARRLGFSGKFAINPRQVAAINAAFTPTSAELEEARAIVGALEDAKRLGSGVAVHRGRMIDRPVALAAQRVIDRARS